MYNLLDVKSIGTIKAQRKCLKQRAINMFIMTMNAGGVMTIDMLIVASRSQASVFYVSVNKSMFSGT